MISPDKNSCRASKRDKYSENGKPSTLIEINQSNISENSNEMSITMKKKKLNRAVESNTGKIWIKRNFTLNSKSDLDVWLDQLHSELSECELTEHINNPEKFRNDVSENTIKMKNKIRGNIDTSYYEMLQNLVIGLKI